MKKNETKVIFNNDHVYVSYDGGEFVVNNLDNAWLWVIGAIYNNSKIVIEDKREELQDHQYNMTCTRD